MLGKGWAGTSNSLLEQQRILMHETKGDELGKAAGFVLNFAQELELIHPMNRGFDVSIHQS